MTSFQHLGIVGSGPTALYLLRNLVDRQQEFAGVIEQISIFERDPQLGYGMPYNPRTTDHHNICNISSEELPRLQTPFADWLETLTPERRGELGVQADSISHKETYARIALGEYFHVQWNVMVDLLNAAGIRVNQYADCGVADITQRDDTIHISTHANDRYQVDRVVIATGHNFGSEDAPKSGYYASPWPIQKILPSADAKYNFSIGMLGASLSAFDVVSSLAHRHGEFHRRDGRLQYQVDDDAKGFRIVLHAANGWLPHLQYEQAEPFREIYRDADRQQILNLIDDDGFLTLDRYFDDVCRPALMEAFEKDDLSDVAALLAQNEFGLEALAAEMESRHEYDDAFAGMRREMPEAVESVTTGQPMHWKETLDDLMYTLNFHAEYLPGQDHLRFRKTIMPFLMNVIAAMPLPSARTLLALHEAGRLDLVTGHVSVQNKGEDQTVIEIDNEGEVSTQTYKMFIDCSGQKPLQVKDYPFRSLAQQGTIRSARVAFAGDDPKSQIEELDEDDVIDDHGRPMLKLGGVDIDSRYRVIGNDGVANPRILEVAFPHTTGIRPYSYGLQACNETARIVVQSWAEELVDGGVADGGVEDDDERAVTATHQSLGSME